MKNPCYKSGISIAGMACGVALIGWALGRKLAREKAPGPAAANRKASEALNRSSAILSFSVLADSTVQHYGGCFSNPLMYLAPSVSTVVLAESTASAAGVASENRLRPVVFSLGVVTGLIGTGFHLYNILKREGSFSWHNAFYGAPVGAPGAVVMAGVFGLAAEYLSDEPGGPSVEGVPVGRAVAALAAFGIAATVAEAFLFHFRGAFQDVFQYTPIAVPTAAAAALCIAAVRPSKIPLAAASASLKATAVVGLAGVGFHAYAIHRNMGGWRNWSQMVLQGPPLPAPLGFTGMALAGLAALSLLSGEHNHDG